MTYDGIVLAGGAGRRLGGPAKPSLAIGSRRLLDVALEALAGAQTTVVVGPALPTAHPVVWTREAPVGGGPVAALEAALRCATAPMVALLAADLPFVTAAAVERLVAEAAGRAATVAVDAGGRDQPLLACYAADALRAAMPTVTSGASMRSLLTTLAATGGVRRLDLGGQPPVTWDCDTIEDLDEARELA